MKKRISKAITTTAIATVLLGTIGVAQAQDYNFVKINLDWPALDHGGFNEDALCGFNALRGVPVIQLPNVPPTYEILANVWDRASMMKAAQTAFNLGYVDAAVNAAICSEAHNPAVANYLAQNRGLIIQWFASHGIPRYDAPFPTMPGNPGDAR